jgi:hypothetical protein
MGLNLDGSSVGSQRNIEKGVLFVLDDWKKRHLNYFMHIESVSMPLYFK